MFHSGSYANGDSKQLYVKYLVKSATQIARKSDCPSLLVYFTTEKVILQAGRRFANTGLQIRRSKSSLVFMYAMSKIRNKTADIVLALTVSRGVYQVHIY